MNLLKQLYKKYDVLVEMNMNVLINIKKVASCSYYEGLRRLSENVQVHTRGLESLGLKSVYYVSMLLPLLRRS